MDVQQVASPLPNSGAAAVQGQADPAIKAAAAAGAVPAQAGATADADAHAQQPGGIAPVVAKIFGNEGIPHPVTLNVSYRVDGKEIVTVFSDPKSGKEIAQFPSELMIKLAEFFDKSHGATLDQSA